MRRTARKFWKDRGGATAIEYGLIVAVLSLAIVAGVGSAMNAVEGLFADNTGKLQQAFR